MKECKIEELQAALFLSWSSQSSTLWKAENPALGQCGVTALVVQDVLGGEILRTPYGDIWHFYNQVDGRAVDFTESQFDSDLRYEDIASNREEAFSDTNQSQYDHLKAAVIKCLEDGARSI